MDSGEIAGSPAPFDGEIGYIDIASVAPGRISKTTTYDFAMHRAGPAVSYFTVTSFGRRASELQVACRHLAAGFEPHRVNWLRSHYAQDAANRVSLRDDNNKLSSCHYSDARNF